MQVHTICRRAIVSTFIVLLAIFVFEPRAMSEDPTEGFAPLDRVSLTMTEEQVPLLMKVLQQFAKDESLKTAKGEFQRDSREGYQLRDSFWFSGGWSGKLLRFGRSSNASVAYRVLDRNWFLIFTARCGWSWRRSIGQCQW